MKGDLSHVRVSHVDQIHFSHFITERKIHHLYSLINTQDDFDSADLSNMLDACDFDSADLSNMLDACHI